MKLRSARERVFQVIAYEIGGLLVVVPLYSLLYQASGEESLFLLVCLSGAVLAWSPVHNCLFDIADLHLSGRVASDRPRLWRLVHASSHEVSTVFLTWPLLVWIGGHDWIEALVVDVVLSLFYTFYAYVFHLVFDRLRPVRD